MFNLSPGFLLFRLLLLNLGFIQLLFSLFVDSLRAIIAAVHHATIL